ncbi:amino acid/amide ABC transporter membrane protein 2, HAAT family [Roseovarius lutimaris]|uniref:Amino acid/amide ABC transporter membrane protein 2, HAAT family n=1 Tax=Roseovarius lutimaris TaxID=1005928 RepID=A0A1I5GSL7_9RHOB|nr:branched-chain amino acid ABC transporter permease [Roseovarius lutimaris]SFO38846.1 amino acid/amide ABC transporter membrane protein 2, HAAT family [Roseovarius lutimaris]
MMVEECFPATRLKKDMALLPRRIDKLMMIAVLVVALALPPFLGDYWLKGVMIPMLILSISALGLNIVTGFAGLISLGQGAFMAVGAFTGVIAYGRYGIPIPLTLLIAGAMAAAVGAVVGAPSLRIKGLYLLVATLAAQFIILWVIQRVPWIGAGSMVTINTPPVFIAGLHIDEALEQYYFALCVAALLTVFALNLTRSRVGRAWMAIREQDVAASVMGVSMLRYKLMAFMISAFYGGIAGAMVVFAWVGAASVQEYDLDLSIQLLGMIIIGGLGSVLGSYLGAIFVALFPIAISIAMHNIYAISGGDIVSAATLANAEHLLFGALIVFFLIVEPLGLSHLWHRFSGSVEAKLSRFPTTNQTPTRRRPM